MRMVASPTLQVFSAICKNVRGGNMLNGVHLEGRAHRLAFQAVDDLEAFSIEGSKQTLAFLMVGDGGRRALSLYDSGNLGHVWDRRLLDQWLMVHRLSIVDCRSQRDWWCS